MVQTPIGNTLVSQVYGYEVVILLEIQMSSLHVALATKITEEDNDRLYLQELEALDEKRLQDLKGLQQKVRGEGLQERKFGLTYQVTYGHDTQDQRQIPTQVGRTFHDRDNLLEQIPPNASKWQHAHEVD